MKITTDSGIQAKYNLWVDQVSQAELSRKTGINTATISAWKTRFPGLSQITKVLLALNKTPNDLMLDDGPEEASPLAPDLEAEITELLVELAKLHQLIGSKKYRPVKDVLSTIKGLRQSIEAKK